jgi:hypothetical protein
MWVLLGSGSTDHVCVVCVPDNCGQVVAGYLHPLLARGVLFVLLRGSTVLYVTCCMEDGASLCRLLAPQEGSRRGRGVTIVYVCAFCHLAVLHMHGGGSGPSLPV